MSSHVKIFIIILLAGATAILAFRYTRPFFEESYQRSTSDAADIKHSLQIGMDNWVGYFPLCSPEMNRRLRSRSIKLKCIDDQADYPARFEKLDKHELDFAVATVDSYLLNGASFDFPGVIISVIDESKGGDAIVANTAKVENLASLKKKADLRVAFTPGSPSEHLLKSIGTHFDIPRLRDKRGAWRVEAEGSSDALKRLLKNDVDVAVVWEPDVSRAVSKSGIDVLISSKDTDKLIVDILLADRRLLRDNPSVAEEFMKVYFDTLRYYHQNQDQLQKDIEESTGLNDEQVRAMLGGVAWTSLSENAVGWYGITGSSLYGDEALIDAINASLDVLIDNHDFDDNPLPDQNPYRLTNRDIIETLYSGRSFANQQQGSSSAKSLSREFKPLDNEAWLGLQEIGNLRVEPISFRRGSGNLDLDGKQSLDKMAERLKRYPNFRILVKGHTGIRGDKQANLDLSSDRAEAVARYLRVTYQLDPNRIHSLGFGGSKPLPRQQGESNRAYSYRLPRVEIALVFEEY